MVYFLMKGGKPMKPKCPECQSKNILYRRGSKSFWCRVCGAEWNKKKNKKGVK